jgi:hypothetical protein
MLRSFHCPFSVHLIDVVASFSPHQKVTIFPQVPEHPDYGALREIQFINDPASSLSC